MARVKLNTGFDYYGDKKDYYVQMKRRRFPWWIFLLLLIPLFIWLYKEYEERKTEEVVEEPEPPVEEEDDLPDPVPGCGVHFSRRHLSDEDNFGFGKIFQQDYYSKYVGAGEFPSCSDAFSLGDFHGVAIDKGTRLIVYKEPNFQGDVLCDITGPLLINCSACTSHSDDAMTKDYIPELQVLFPPENRKLEHDFYGDLYLYDWCYGSCKIICEPCQEEEEKEEPQPEQPTYKEGDPLPKPTENCGVHFSGRVLGDKYNYKYAANGDAEKLTKYCRDTQYGNNGFTDNLGVLQASDDAATVNMGFVWRMPTYKEWEELTKYCDCEWTNNYHGKGVKGYIVKNKRDNKKFIFLPAASCYGGENGEFLILPDDDVRGFYWSSTIYEKNSIGAWAMSFFYRYMGTDDNLSDRAIGQSVRAVRR